MDELYTLEVRITKNATDSEPEKQMIFITFPDVDQVDMETFRKSVFDSLSDI